MKINKPFYHFYPAYDICMCNNTKCKKRFDCFRFMGKPEERHSIANYPNECDSFWPYVIWKDSRNRELTLKQISNDHLKNIIIHLFERIEFNGDDGLIQLVKEFIKEAKRRKIYK
ncbi:MAG: hypothetical protein NC222_06870 [Staphylococcus sp.]|nr:hypothetical protein [Staphylococcus sp.]